MNIIVGNRIHISQLKEMAVRGMTRRLGREELSIEAAEYQACFVRFHIPKCSPPIPHRNINNALSLAVTSAHWLPRRGEEVATDLVPQDLYSAAL